MREVGVIIADRYGVIVNNSFSFQFETIKELDEDIDKCIKNDLYIRRAIVTIDDHQVILSSDEVESLEKLGYGFE